MNRSARSGKQNIVEGWKRNSTKEYYDFLGFSMAANAELEEDCDDIIKGIYPDLRRLKGIMGERGAPSTDPTFQSPSTPSSRQSLSAPFTLSEVEKIPFYPLDPSLPPIVQLKLRAKELHYLLHQLQKSLVEKMGKEKTMAGADKLRLVEGKHREEKNFEAELREKYNLLNPDD